MTRQNINSRPEMSNMLICANLLVRDGEKYFVMKRSLKKKFAPGYVVPYGGKLNLGENAISCAIRELAEESGLTAKDITLSAVVTEIHESPQMLGNWLTYYFVGNYKSGDLIVTPEGENLKLTLPELKKEKLFPSFREILPFITVSERPVVAVCKYNNNHELIENEIISC